MRKVRLLVFLLFVAGLITLWLHFHYLPRKQTFRMWEMYDNITGAPEAIVPNIVHFIMFGQSALNFIAFLSLSSALKVQKPRVILIHTDVEHFGGHYLAALKMLSFPNTTIMVTYCPRPTHVYGQPLSSVYHATDVARIQVLMECGGIYMDSDTLVLKPLDNFRHFEMTVGWPQGEYVGTQVLLAHKDARFLKLWLNGYRYYRPRLWYYNAGQHPTQQILEKNPGLVHRVPVLFGVHNLMSQLYGSDPWPQWRDLFTVHLLSRHTPLPQLLDEVLVKTDKTPFGEIARWILYQLQPPSVFPAYGAKHKEVVPVVSKNLCGPAWQNNVEWDIQFGNWVLDRAQDSIVWACLHRTVVFWFKTNYQIGMNLTETRQLLLTYKNGGADMFTNYIQHFVLR